MFIFCLVSHCNASCNKTRECDEVKYIQCSRKACLCYNTYYPFNQTCFPSKSKELILAFNIYILVQKLIITKTYLLLLKIGYLILSLIYMKIYLYLFQIFMSITRWGCIFHASDP